MVGVFDWMVPCGQCRASKAWRIFRHRVIIYHNCLEANWALYCDNYLEGFHVAYVHPALNNALDMKNYTYELFPYCNLQLGVASEGEPCFDIPEGAQDYGKNIYAYYWHVFPNLMFNFYPPVFEL